MKIIRFGLVIISIFVMIIATTFANEVEDGGESTGGRSWCSTWQP